jgi:hypothetical protein
MKSKVNFIMTIVELTNFNRFFSLLRKIYISNINNIKFII